MYKKIYSVLVILHSILFNTTVIGFQWDRSVNLNDEYRLLWSTKDDEIIFEVQVRTLGYIGLGFSRDGQAYGSDIVIGWIEQGKPYYQDRHIKKYGDGEPFIDPSSQDYSLLLGFENATHTVMRFKRKLDTCDTSYDIPITNDTMKIVYMYHKNDPRYGSVIPGSLPNPKTAFKGYKPLYLLQIDYNNKNNNNKNGERSFNANKMHILELRNHNVKLPLGDDTLYWCKMFNLQDFYQKHHLIRYEPIFNSMKSRDYLEHIILYECQGNSTEMQSKSKISGESCSPRHKLPCNSIVAAWFRGSTGFSFPQDVGFLLDSSQNSYYLLETHYYNPIKPKDIQSLHRSDMIDSSGIRFYLTSTLRKHDAGVLSVGMDPNWRHIIPPGHENVISEGHCIDDCTRKTFPPQGISIFAVIMQTHKIGNEVKLLQIRKQDELLEIAKDENLDYGYRDYRKLSTPVNVLPGDRLTMQCKYNSSLRSAITLGGFDVNEEQCNAFVIYYPRVKQLTSCHSMPSLSTVLQSLGIGDVAKYSNPVMILSPIELAGMTLEYRLVSYDWRNQFDFFQDITRTGSFLAICLDGRNVILQGTDSERHNVLTNRFSKPSSSNCNVSSSTSSLVSSLSIPSSVSSFTSSSMTLYDLPYSTNIIPINDNKNIYVTEEIVNDQQQNNLDNDSTDAESLSLNGSNKIELNQIIQSLLYISIYFIISRT